MSWINGNWTHDRQSEQIAIQSNESGFCEELGTDTHTNVSVVSTCDSLSLSLFLDLSYDRRQICLIDRPYVVAQGLLNVLRFGESGSIWVIESGRQPYEIYVPNPRTLRRCYKNDMTCVETKIGKERTTTKVCDGSTRTSVICA